MDPTPSPAPWGSHKASRQLARMVAPAAVRALRLAAARLGPQPTVQRHARDDLRIVEARYPALDPLREKCLDCEADRFDGRLSVGVPGAALAADPKAQGADLGGLVPRVEAGGAVRDGDGDVHPGGLRTHRS